MIEYVESEPSSEAPRPQNIKHLKRQERTPPHAQSRTKLNTIRSKSKQNFLTDPQTSDHTQKSTSSTKIRVQILEQKLHKLQKQNSQLRQQIITMKANQFYTINQEKVKMAIHQNEKLRQEICEIRKINEELEIQNEFLQRQNKSLKDDLQKTTNSNYRKSVETAKSRTRQNTAKTIKNQTDRAKGEPQDNDNKNGVQYSSTKYQKKTIHSAKSNPHLMKFCTEEVTDFSSKQRESKTAGQITKRLKDQNDPLRSENEHFLREFEKYEKQLAYNSKKTIGNPGQYRTSRGITHLEEQSNDQDEDRRNPKQVSRESRGKRSKSKESSLQAILNKKKEIMGRREREEQEKYNYGGKNQEYSNKRQRIQRVENDQNYMGQANQVQRRTFNEEYLIGKATKYSSPNNKYHLNQQQPMISRANQYCAYVGDGRKA